MQVLVQYRWVSTKHSYTVVVLRVYGVKRMQAVYIVHYAIETPMCQ